MYVNFDCDIASRNVFENLINLLTRSAFPVNSQISMTNTLALDGLVAVIQGMAERIEDAPPLLESTSVNLEVYMPFWMMRCDNCSDPRNWVPFVRQMKSIKKKLMIAANHFTQDRKKGFAKFLQEAHLLPEEIDPHSVACLFMYTAGLDKNLIGDFLGNHGELCIQVLHEFVGTFDFRDMCLDTALRIFLETFRLNGESKDSKNIFVDKDAALTISYSLILLNTDQHNVQVRKKMTEEDFIQNNRGINDGNDLPREFLSNLYHSICKNEIRTAPEQGASFPDMMPSLWIDLIHKSKKTAPHITMDNCPYLEVDMFDILAGPTIAAISVVFDDAEDEDIYQLCIDGFLGAAKTAAFYHIEDVMDDLVISFVISQPLESIDLEEFIMTFGEDTKAKMATTTLCTIANRYGDLIRMGWRNILDCILRLHEVSLLSAIVVTDAADDSAVAPDSWHEEKPLTKSFSSAQMPSTVMPRRSPGLIGRFSQFLSFDAEETRPRQPTNEELAAHQHTLETIQQCQIQNIFIESKFLVTDSLLQLSQAIIAAGRSSRETDSPEDEGIAVFCLKFLITVTLNNRDRILLLWKGVYEHISNVQSSVMPSALLQKAVFGLLSICWQLLLYKENLANELLRSLQLILKLDARVADSYCEQITQDIGRLIKANATHIRSQVGWRTVLSLLAITARHSEAGFDALSFIMSNRSHLLPSNFVLCVDAARQFAESHVGQVKRSLHALDLMAGSVDCLVRWAHETHEGPTVEDAAKTSRDIGDMWLRLLQGLRKICSDNREEVRNRALLSLQKCFVVVHEVSFLQNLWLRCFDPVIFAMPDELLGIVQEHTQKNYRDMEGTLMLAMKLLSKVFLLSIDELIRSENLSKLWLDVLSQMEKYMKVKIRGKKNEKLWELLPKLLKNTLLVMKTRCVLVQGNASHCDGLWDSTWYE
ncbi:hypothetical protein Nepgr_012222 [Nepenthes gracilis]|uniref:SEC7 domain-containing protein n=1 Tax=Nepenthes gracilis TaxID=150966 RepID=A0AAD3XN34_NEPGR|nr:hypothetical protein Nepgr_012222 [Nepenthes gracilis]